MLPNKTELQNSIENEQNKLSPSIKIQSIYEPYYPKIKNELPPLMYDLIEASCMKSSIVYPEYIMSNMLFIGSLITCGRAEYAMPFTFGSTPETVSFRNIISSQLPVSGKTTAINYTLYILDEIKDKWHMKKYGQNIDIQNINDTNYPNNLMDITTQTQLCQDFSEHNNRYLISAYCEHIFYNLNKNKTGHYLTQICKNISFCHQTKNTMYNCINPVFNCVLETDTKTFTQHGNKNKIQHLWYEFLFCCPSYNRKRIPSTKEIIKNSEKAQEIVNNSSDRLANIMLYFESAKKPIIYRFSNECIDFFNTWVQEKNKNLNEEKQLSLQTQFESYVKDIAVILHVLSEHHAVTTIELPTLRLAAELIDGLFRPSAEFMLNITNSK